MASPFSVFRKNKKVLIAATAILAIFAFVLADVLVRMVGRGPEQNPVLVRTARYGDLRWQQIDHMMTRRNQLRAFLERVVWEATNSEFAVRFYLERFGEVNEDHVVDLWLFAERAQEMGIVVTDTMINAYIRELTGDQLSYQELVEIIGAVGMTERQLFDAMRLHLLSQKLLDLHVPALLPTTPAERWDYFQRLRRNAQIEAAAVPVADFTDEVPEPDEATLRAFFDEHRERHFHPASPHPGFREPPRVALEYLKVDYESFLDPDSISEEEARRHYEQNKDRLWVRMDLPDLPEEPSEEEVEEGRELIEEAETLEPEPAEPEAAEPEVVEPEAAEPEAVEPEPAEPEAAEPEAMEPEPAEPEAVEPEAADPELAEEPEPKPAGEAVGESAEENGETPSPAEGAQHVPEGPWSPESPWSFVAFEEAAPEGAGEDDPPAAVTVEGDAGEAAPPAAPDIAAPAEDDPAAPAVGEPAPEEAERPREYIPFEEVEEEIRITLARGQARSRIEAILAPVRRAMDDYYEQFILFGADSEQLPERPDLSAVADQAGVTYVRTDLLSPYELNDLNIGDATVEGFAQGEQDVVSVVFRGLLEFQPTVASDVNGNQYLFWKYQQTEERVPSYDDPGVRGRVLTAWKLVQARQLAMAEAEELAEEARRADGPIRTVVGDTRPVIEPEPFTWLTFGLVPQTYPGQEPMLNDVEGIDTPGSDFMRAVFALREGGIGVAPNEPRSIFYVVRMVGSSPPEDVLWDQFQREPFESYRAAGRSDQRQLQLAIFEKVREEAGLEWLHRPRRTVFD